MALTSPNNIRTPDSGDEYALTVDLGVMADTIEAALVYSSGTGAPTGGGEEGKLYLDKSTNITYRYTAAFGWRRTSPSRGFFVGVTVPSGQTAPGTVTVSHGLGQEPAHVFVTDRNSGAIPGQRKIVPGAMNTTQIQFVVYNSATGATIPNNPVEFYWIAYPSQ